MESDYRQQLKIVCGTNTARFYGYIIYVPSLLVCLPGVSEKNRVF